mgnify:FL=1
MAQPDSPAGIPRPEVKRTPKLTARAYIARALVGVPISVVASALGWGPVYAYNHSDDGTVITAVAYIFAFVTHGSLVVAGVYACIELLGYIGDKAGEILLDLQEFVKEYFNERK